MLANIAFNLFLKTIHTYSWISSLKHSMLQAHLPVLSL